ncbi:hypothetical protein SCHPADRAFT_899383 [Schizopora paradoxa]|uniref:Transmembrane protein n=1 Tax=Schizopora paradoxa TaxID=27342 RepID=A0A0H2S3C7_9AGAM|nr:hypothetical protein SCHPADRAFT_899383 [Schizopora paradoxa]
MSKAKLKLSFVARLVEPRPTNPSLEYARRRRLHALYILLLASVLFWSATIAILSASGYYNQGRFARAERAGDRHEVRMPEADSRVHARERGHLKRYEIQGRWKELHTSLGLEVLPDASFHPDILPLVDKDSEEHRSFERDPKDVPGQRRKRSDTEYSRERPSSQPDLFLADDSQSSPTETLNHLRATFQRLARRDQLEKALRRIRPR